MNRFHTITLVLLIAPVANFNAMHTTEEKTEPSQKQLAEFEFTAGSISNELRAAYHNYLSICDEIQDHGKTSAPAIEQFNIHKTRLIGHHNALNNYLKSKNPTYVNNSEFHNLLDDVKKTRDALCNALENNKWAHFVSEKLRDDNINISSIITDLMITLQSAQE